MKLAFVVQRYGADIAGGSEAHCRDLAHRLAPRHDITVLTTCARDYVTWRNAMPAGESRDGAVRVLRFPVRRPRRLKVFAELSDDVFDGQAAPTRQDDWFRENGPDTPALLDHLQSHGHAYDLVLFWTFRYAPSYFGVPLVADRAVLVPTAEEDAAIRLPVLEAFFRKPAGYLFLTLKRKRWSVARAGRPLRPAATIGIGLEPVAPRRPEPRQRATAPAAAARHPTGVRPLPGSRRSQQGVRHAARLFPALSRRRRWAGHDADTRRADEDAWCRSTRRSALSATCPTSLRTALLAHARFLIVPSPYESLSIVLLEAWNHATPALVNARCRVLAGTGRAARTAACTSARLGNSARRSATCSHMLTSAPRSAARACAYVEREYRWPNVLGRVEQLLDEVVGARTRSDGAATR